MKSNGKECEVRWIKYYMTTQRKSDVDDFGPLFVRIDNVFTLVEYKDEN